VRTVDLAGNSHVLPVADGLAATLEGTGDPRYLPAAPPAPLRYRRFEPVPPPELVPRLPYGPGESLERLAIRSGSGFDALRYAQASQAAADPLLRYQPFCDRHLAAAKASLQMVEAHGMLDDAIQVVRELPLADATAASAPFYAIAARESGSFRDTPGAAVVPIDGPQEGQQSYICLDADAVELPYLPDPLAAGVKARVWLAPDEPARVLDLPFPDGGGWERPLPLRLRLEEGSYDVAYDADARLLTVWMPAGRTGRLRLSSLFAFDPDVFGILDWCRQVAPGGAELVEEAIKDGTHWMTAPWRDLVLVHASQQPLRPAELELDFPPVPGFGPMPAQAVARPRAATAVALDGRLHLDLPSTAQVDLTAAWDEVVDDPERHYDATDDMVTPIRQDVFGLPIPEPFGTPWQEPGVRLFVARSATDDDVVEFHTHNGDFPTPEHGRRHLLEQAAAPGLSAPERRRLEAGAAQLEKLRAHELGDTRHRDVTYQAVASTRFREYFDPHMPAADGTAAGRPQRFEILSSAPPAKPVVTQVLPLMGHVRSADGATTTSRRRGFGLRVWLGRPWFSSGAGELLAVVCDGNTPHVPDGELSREVTMVVQDPARASAMPPPLSPESFPGAVLRRPGVPLAGSSHLARAIAAFEPVWDRDRQAWFCDVELPTGAAYFPFVRLGLARYQPLAIAGCELSPIVPTAFVQTVPDRTLSCAVDPDGTAAVSLSGPAPSAAMDATGAVTAGTNVVTAVVEAQEPAFADPLLGWSAAGTEVELTATLAGDGTATWTGAVPVPVPAPAPDAAGRRLRLTVREFETHSADDRSTEPPGLIAVRRLVHADVVPL